MKQILVLIFIFSFFNAFADDYCNAVTTTEDEYISNVEFGDINNSSGWSSEVTIYNDTTDIDLDEDYIIEVTIENYYDNDSLSVWIDIDHSDTYDRDERLKLNHNGSVFIGTINISSGSDFEYGLTRMRLRLTYGIAPVPCDSLNYGETEDYFVKIDSLSEEDYCNAVTTTEDEYISNVEFGDINNSSGWSSEVTIYNDTTDIDLDEDYIIEVTIENYYDNDSLSVWIDIDHSDTYDRDERLKLNHNGSVFIGTINISSGSDFEYGLTRMRLRLTYGIAPEPCDSLNYGETEDYYVKIDSSSEDEDEYCAAETTTEDSYIANVRFIDINNSSDWNSDVTIYDQDTDLELDKTHWIVVEVGDYREYDSVSVWIDYDNNETFDDDEEFSLFSWAYRNYNKFYAGYINISSDSDFGYGTTRMRVRLTNAETPVPCGTLDYGETEDYFVQIIDPADSYCKGIILWEEEYISNVEFSNINNSSDWDYKVNIYDDEVAEIKLDTNYIISVTVHDYVDGDTVKVWIDLDQNESFHTNEIFSLTHVGDSVFKDTINISSSSEFAYGQTRMRVQLARGSIEYPCYGWTYGETEDYYVDISEPESEDGYCESVSNNKEQYISNVRFIDIDNSSDWNSDVTLYNHITDLELDKSYLMLVTVKDYGDTDSIGVWIDYDQSQTFDDNEKYILDFWGWGQGTIYRTNITISGSSDFEYGQTRMRLRLTDGMDVVPCEYYDYGETEDYYVNIVDSEDSYCNRNIMVDNYKISRVEFAGIDNNSGWHYGVTVYDDVAEIDLDSNYIITVTTQNVSNGDSLSVWIDLDHSETYDNYEEFKMYYTGNNVFKDTINISSSSDFEYGQTRMRLSLAQSNSAQPCGTVYGGETEDYYVNINNTSIPDISKEINVKLYMQGNWDGSEHNPIPVLCEIRTGTTLMNSTMVKRVAAIVDSLGYAIFDFGNANDGDYWIVVRAGGYLPLGSTSKVSLSSSGVSYDFTDDDSKAAGGLTAVTEINGYFLIKAGDLNYDRRIYGSDTDPIRNNNGSNLRYDVPE